uniref:XRE family transcriptional regulator n=1 Tax=Pararhizobium sp. IMCC3301 TaxID=3067904 RepID=UPI002741AF94|nr:XRE family transcriptional regulator [Pararhizobium sp. IMCC3301]
MKLSASVVDMHRQAIKTARGQLVELLQAYERLRNGGEASARARWKSEPGIALIIARIAKGWSQADLAEKLGMREQQVQRYEAERYRSINLQRFREIASTLQMKLEVLPDGRAQFLGQAHSPTMSNAELAKITSHGNRAGWFDVDDQSSNQAEIVENFIRSNEKSDSNSSLLRTGLSTLDLSCDAYLAVWRARIVQVASGFLKAKAPNFEQSDLTWLPDLVRLSRRNDGPAMALQFLRQKGIIVVVEPQIPGLSLDGAAFTVRGRPVIGITVRHDRIDNFWYTLLHELGHVFLHYQIGLAAGFFDEELETEQVDELESQANEFASELLIPTHRWKLSNARISKSADVIESFAENIGIHSAIVFGRIRKERNDYKLFANRVGSGRVRNELMKVEKSIYDRVI